MLHVRDPARIERPRQSCTHRQLLRTYSYIVGYIRRTNQLKTKSHCIASSLFRLALRLTAQCHRDTFNKCIRSTEYIHAHLHKRRCFHDIITGRDIDPQLVSPPRAESKQAISHHSQQNRNRDSMRVPRFKAPSSDLNAQPGQPPAHT